MIRRAVSLLALITSMGCAISVGDRSSRNPSAEEAPGEILRVLEEQARAWNRGDLEGFMEGYWRSADLVFTSGGRVQRGWQATLDRYQETYGGSTSTMGQLSFYDLEIHAGDSTAWVLGRWALDRGGEDLGGVFTLVFRRFGSRWLIVHDHTSSGP